MCQLVLCVFLLISSAYLTEGGIVPSPYLGYGEEIVPIETKAEVVRPVIGYGAVPAAPGYAKEGYGLGYGVAPVLQPVVNPILAKEAYARGYVGTPVVEGYIAPVAGKPGYGVEYAPLPVVQPNLIPIDAKELYGVGYAVPHAADVRAQGAYGLGYVGTPALQFPVAAKEVPYVAAPVVKDAYGVGYVSEPAVKEYVAPAIHGDKHHGFFKHAGEGLGLGHKFENF